VDLKQGGVNFDAKTRRNSTDLADIFYAHIGGMDTFARALLAAHAILEDGEYLRLRKDRYASFNTGKGKQFAQGKLNLSNLSVLAHRKGEPEQISGRQEYLENILNKFI
jgi:xylose isomerase